MAGNTVAHTLTRSEAVTALALLAVGIPAAASADVPKELRIGYQKIGTLLILKEQGLLAQRLAHQGTTITWVEFQAGPPLLEALNAGSIDFGYTGDTPPIFAQAAGVDFVYVAAEPNPGQSSAILVRDAANIKTLADLRGKKIALTKGSSAQNVLVRVLAKGGIAYADIEPVYLQPADAAAALRNGSVDAWSIWDPFYALGEHYPGVHVLTNALGIAASNSFYLAGRTFAAQHPDVIRDVIDEAGKAVRWAQTHQDALAQVLANASGVDLGAEKVVAARGNYAIGFLTPAIVAQQQTIADTFAKLGLLPQPVVVRANVWTPTGAIAATIP